MCDQKVFNHHPSSHARLVIQVSYVLYVHVYMLRMGAGGGGLSMLLG